MNSRIVRLALAAAVVLAVAIAIHRLCMLRYDCNIEEARAERRITTLFAQADQPSARLAARQIIETMDRCIACAPADVAHHMARAAALRMLDRPAEAAEEYRRALTVDRRAELYLNAGLSELEAGRDAQAEDALITAMIVFYSNYEVIPPPMKFRVVLAVNPIYATIQEHRAPPSLRQELFDRVARLPKE